MMENAFEKIDNIGEKNIALQSGPNERIQSKHLTFPSLPDIDLTSDSNSCIFCSYFPGRSFSTGTLIPEVPVIAAKQNVMLWPLSIDFHSSMNLNPSVD